MKKTSVLLIALPFALPFGLFLAAPAARAGTLLPAEGSGLELAASLMLTLAALVAAYLGLRRSLVTEERARTLQGQLAVEREARGQADQALAANHEVLCRLARQNEDVREGERGRIARELQGELGRRLLHLRSQLAGLHDSATLAPGTSLADRIDGVLADLDGALGVVRSVAGGLRGFGPGNGLRHALERCLAEHAHVHGVRYRFDTGVDPAGAGTPSYDQDRGHDRAARLAVFQVLQEALAAAGRRDGADLYVRLSEGATRLKLDIDIDIDTDSDIGSDSGAGRPRPAAGLSPALAEQVRVLGGAVRVADGASHGGWSLSLPVRRPVAAG